VTIPAGRRGDYFSAQSSDYARYRPHYPGALFASIASLCRSHTLAWDCATGNAQAAVPLADHFTSVIATDVSLSQLLRAAAHKRVFYAGASADAACLADRSADLVNVAQALHWFDLDAFYAEVNRVVRPGGVISVSSYGSASIDDSSLSSIFTEFEWGTLGDFWPPRRRYVGEALRDLPFPFAELAAPQIALEARWTLAELIGYARSWSAAARYRKACGREPTGDVEAALRRKWGPPESRRLIRWPFVIRIGRVAA
jgi:SAM-dependent methyltransferase